MVQVSESTVILSCLAVSMACSSCYVNSLGGEFVYDDGAAIKKNDDVTGNGTIADIFIHDFWGQPLQDQSSHKSYRPLSTLCFRVIWSVGRGSPLPFHIVSVAGHILVGGLVGLLCCRILLHSYTPRTSFASSLWCSAMFATHPVHTEAVSNIVSFCEILCSIFFLLSFLAYARARGTGQGRSGSMLLHASSAVLFICSILSKETGLTLIGLFVTYDVITLADLYWQWRAKAPMEGKDRNEDAPQLGRNEDAPQLGGMAARQLMFWFIAWAYLSWKRHLTGDMFLPKITVLDNSAANAPNRVSVALSLLQTHAVYARLLVLPTMLSCDYGRNTLANITSVSDPRNLFAAGAYAGLAVLVLLSRLLIKYRASSSLVQATLWLTVPFALSSNLLFPVGTVVGERLLYLPSVGFCIILAHLVAEFVEAGGRGVDNGGPELMANGSEDRVKHPGTTSVQGAGVKSKGRAPGQARGPSSGAYRDDVAAFPLDLSGILLWARGWRFIVSSLACGILCSAYAVRSYIRNPVWSTTIGLFEAHTRIVPHSVRMHHGFAGELANSGEHKIAAMYYRKAIRLLRDEGFAAGVRETDMHREMLALYSWELANCLTESGQAEKALKHYKKAVSLEPGVYRYQNRLAFNLVQSRRYDEGFEAFFACYTLRPEEADMINNLGNVFMAKGQTELAIRTYRLSQRIEPSNADTRYNMGVLQLRTSGMQMSGVANLMRAARLEPGDANIAAAKDHAISMYKKAVGR